MGDHRKENLNGWYSPLSPVWLSWCRSTETSCREGHAAFQNYEVVGSDNGTHFHVPLMPRWCRGRASSGTGTSGSKRRQWWDEVVVLVDEGEMKSWTRSIRNWHHSATQAEKLWPTCRSLNCLLMTYGWLNTSGLVVRAWKNLNTSWHHVNYKWHLVISDIHIHDRHSLSSQTLNEKPASPSFLTIGKDNPSSTEQKYLLLL